MFYFFIFLGWQSACGCQSEKNKKIIASRNPKMPNFRSFFRIDNRKRIANRKKKPVFVLFSFFLAEYPKAENLWVISRVLNPILLSKEKSHVIYLLFLSANLHVFLRYFPNYKISLKISLNSKKPCVVR